jgi:hypothetical protein
MIKVACFPPPQNPNNIIRGASFYFTPPQNSKNLTIKIKN